MMETCFLTSGQFTKRAKAKRIVAVHPLKRLAAKRGRITLAHRLHAFFVHQAPKIIAQVIDLRGKMGKAQLSDDEIDALAELLGSIDFSGWAVLAGDVADVIEEIARDGSLGAVAQLGIDTTANADMLNIVNQEALDYSAERSAEMVGMRRTAAGKLIENPNARWQITDGTREYLRADVREAMEKGWSNDVLAQKLADSYAFSDKRAMLIARTETIRASNTGALASYTAAGVEEKEWTTADDDLVSEDCQANQDQGPISINEAFDSGDDAPPAHPNCRCVVVPVVHFASESNQPTEE